MTFFRTVKRESPFVQIDKELVNDSHISAKAKGIMMYLLSKPDGWKIYESDIVNHMKDGKDSIKSGIKELVDRGYIVRERAKDDSGKFRGYNYTVYETVADNPQRKNRDGKPDNGKTALINNDINNNDINNNNSISLANEIFEYWNSKDIIKHQKLQQHVRDRIDLVIKNRGIDEIKKVIDNYSTVYHSEDHFFKTRYTLNQMLRNKDLDQFGSEADPLNNFLRFDKQKGNQPMSYAAKRESDLMAGRTRRTLH